MPVTYVFYAIMRCVKRLAYIPARGGSKGVPRKNIRLLNGKPLIAHTIETVLKTDMFDTIFVSTDSAEIAEVAVNFGAWVPFLRRAEVARDTTPITETICDDLNRLGEYDIKAETFCLLQPTSPFRSVEDIVSAVLLCEERNEGVVSVSPVEEHPFLMRSIDQKSRLSKLLSLPTIARRQDMPEYYRVNGAIYVCPLSRISEDMVFADLPLGYVMSRDRGLDIDSELDFQRAEKMVSNQKF